MTIDELKLSKIELDRKIAQLLYEFQKNGVVVTDIDFANIQTNSEIISVVVNSIVEIQS